MAINQCTHDLFGREVDSSSTIIHDGEWGALSAFSGCITSFEGNFIRLFGADHGSFRRIKKADRCQLRLGGTRPSRADQGLLKPSHAAAVCRGRECPRSR